MTDPLPNYPLLHAEAEIRRLKKERISQNTRIERTDDEITRLQEHARELRRELKEYGTELEQWTKVRELLASPQSGGVAGTRVAGEEVDDDEGNKADMPIKEMPLKRQSKTNEENAKRQRVLARTSFAAACSASTTKDHGYSSPDNVNHLLNNHINGRGIENTTILVTDLRSPTKDTGPRKCVCQSQELPRGKCYLCPEVIHAGEPRLKCTYCKFIVHTICQEVTHFEADPQHDNCKKDRDEQSINDFELLVPAVETSGAL